jgi:hypothetical protein
MIFKIEVSEELATVCANGYAHFELVVHVYNKLSKNRFIPLKAFASI